MQLTVQDIVRAIGGRCLNPDKNGNILITSITTDTRQIQEGSLFVPLKGEQFDGHHFIAQAFAKGACVSLTQSKETCVEQGCVIWVPDTHKALLDLAAFYRAKHALPVVAITGSVGKTTTKDLVAAVLGAKYNTLKTEGNYNNEIGLPLTLFRLTDQHEIAVVEMGMNHFNEIHRLSMTAAPDVAVITNIGVSHIENLGSQEGILQAKLEIIDGLKVGAPLIVNGDDALLATVKQPAYEMVYCGKNETATYRATEIVQTQEGVSASVHTPQDTYAITIPARGEHMVYNGLVAVAVAEHFGLTKDEILKGLKSYIPSKMRMHIETYPVNGLTVINDAYNASPDSMLAALKVLSGYTTKGRRIAVLGDMFEMGAYAGALHEQVGRYVAEQKIDVLYAVGELSRQMLEGVARTDVHKVTCHHYLTKEACIKELKNNVASGDVLLVKASRGMRFEEIVDAIGKVNNHD